MTVSGTVRLSGTVRFVVSDGSNVGFVSLADSALVRERRCCLVESVVSLVGG